MDAMRLARASQEGLQGGLHDLGKSRTFRGFIVCQTWTRLGPEPSSNPSSLKTFLKGYQRDQEGCGILLPLEHDQTNVDRARTMMLKGNSKTDHKYLDRTGRTTEVLESLWAGNKGGGAFLCCKTYFTLGCLELRRVRWEKGVLLVENQEESSRL